MADLVSVNDFLEYLGEPDADPELVGDILNEVEADFESRCHRSHRPFQAEQPGRIESQYGIGTSGLYLDYPVSVLTTVTVGASPTSMEAVTGVFSREGTRFIRRTDSGVFRGYIEVTYDAAADLPPDLPGVIKAEAARRYRLRGAEDSTSERVGGAEAGLAVAPSAAWEDAVARHRVNVVAS